MSDTDAAMAKVESSGYIPSAIMGGVGMRSELRRIVDSTGQPINATWLDGLEKIYVENSSWDSNKAKYIVGDFKKCVYAIRQDVEFEMFTNINNYVIIFIKGAILCQKTKKAQLG